jgi:carbonic anhydrase/acetyltransferase-like protein (isoleucine patch superfamily)
MKLPFAIILPVLLLVSLQAQAADFRTGERVEIPRGVTIDEDLYVAASTVEINGTVNGDVVAVGNQVTITGEIQGALIAAGSRVLIDGHIERSARVAGNDVQFGPQSRIDRDAIAAGQSVTLAGTLARDGVFAGSQVNIVGQIGRRSIAAVDQLWVADTARMGQLKYYSPNFATIGPAAKIEAIERQAIEQRPRSAFAVGWIAAAIAAFVMGVVLIRFGGPPARLPANSLRTRPGASAGYGVLLLAAVPPLALLAMITVVALPVGILALVLLAFGCYVGYLTSAFAGGEWVLTRLRKGAAPSPYASLALGLVLFAVLGRMPVLGGLLGFVAVVLGLGSQWLSIRGSKWYDRNFRQRPTQSASQPPMATPRPI